MTSEFFLNVKNIVVCSSCSIEYLLSIALIGIALRKCGKDREHEFYL